MLLTLLSSSGLTSVTAMLVSDVESLLGLYPVLITDDEARGFITNQLLTDDEGLRGVSQVLVTDNEALQALVKQVFTADEATVTILVLKISDVEGTFGLTVLRSVIEADVMLSKRVIAVVVF